VSAGIEYRNDFRQDLWNGDVNPAAVYLDQQRNAWNVALFVQNEFSILENLILNGGVRYDYYDTFGSTVNPRLALLYNLHQTTFKALYGTAFRGANAYERFYEGTGFKSNPNLDPETISTYELVVEHALTPYIRATAAGYYYQIDDLVSQELDTSDGLLVFQNKDEVEAMGLELQLEMDDRGPLPIAGRLGYALQEAKDRRTNRRLTNSPAHLINLNLIAPIFLDKLFGGFELLYASERRTLAGGRADDHVVVNSTLFTKNLLRGLEVSASVRNLFDETYFDPGSGEQVQDQIEQDGRTFWLKLKYGF
jgi:iron complex outermembrane receptor protein